jgi:hypothetical protein
MVGTRLKYQYINKTADKYKGVKRKFKEGQKEQTLDDLFFETIKLVKIINPKVCIFENVITMSAIFPPLLLFVEMFCPLVFF